MNSAMKALLRLFFGNEIDKNNFPRVRVLLCLLFILAWFLVIVGMTMGIIAISLQETSFDHKPFNQAANAFLLDLKAGKVTEAYACTSKDYQKEIIEDQFKAIMQRNPYPTNEKGESFLWAAPKNGKTITYWFNDNRGPELFRFTFEVTKEGDKYQISKFSLK